MVFVDNINQLQYYTLAPGEPCYCERLMGITDFYLTDALTADAAMAEVEVLSADALSSYGGFTIGAGDVVEGLRFTVSQQPGGAYYFEITAERWSDIICANRCFLLHVIISGDNGVLFDKYTQLYCLDSCCVVPGGVSVAGGTLTPLSATGTQPTASLTNDCGRAMLTLEAEFDCGDVFSGNTNTPTYKSANVEGIVKRLPHEIVRVIAKCKAQRTEVTPKYEVQISEALPGWKKDELELLLTAPRLWVNGMPVIYPGGTPFSEILKCTGLFKGRFTVEGCAMVQRYGCGETCEATEAAHKSYYGFRKTAPVYRDDKGVVIGYDLEQVADSMRYKEGVGGVSVNAYSGAGEDAAYLEVYGTNKTLPAFLYAGAPVPANRIYKQRLPDFSAPEVFGLPQNFMLCPRPVLDSVTGLSFTTITCAAPVLSEISISFRESCAMPVMDGDLSFFTTH